MGADSVSSLSMNLAPNYKSGLLLSNPVMTASGTSGFGADFSRIIDVSGLGAFVTKTVTPKKRSGNPTPRTVETPSGMINSIGLPNPGIEALLDQEAPHWESLGIPVIVSISGHTVDEFCYLASSLDGVAGVAALEANFSCPNVDKGMEFATEADLLSEATSAIVESTALPLIAKLSPNVTDMRPIAVAAQEAGASAVTIMNTIVGMKIDVNRRRPLIGGVMGGLSGPAIRPIGIRFVYQVYPEVDIPIVGAGGIKDSYDALEYIMAGASSVQVGTNNFVRPDTGLSVVAGLETFLESEAISSVQDIVGIAHSKQ